MNLTSQTKTMSEWLDLLSRARTMVPSVTDRLTLAAAAGILGNRARFVTTIGEPRMLIIAGEGRDPIAEELEWIESAASEMADGLRTMTDHMDDLRRRLKLRTELQAPGTSPWTADALRTTGRPARRIAAWTCSCSVKDKSGVRRAIPG